MKRTSIKRLSFVGSGNVATHLALAFVQAGCEVSQVLSRSFDHAQLLAARVGAQPINQIGLLEADADVYIIATSDDSLYDLALDMRVPPHALVLHTSGTTPAEVLRPIGMRYGVAWSPQTFMRDIAMDYSQLPVCIEGSSTEVLAAIDELFSLVTPNIHHLSLEQRRVAHLASVLVSNFVNAVNASAQDLMAHAGLDFSMLRPLAEQTLRKMDFGRLWPQQTGPAARHDEHTLNAQRRMLADEPQLLALYNLMTDIIQQPHPQHD